MKSKERPRRIVEHIKLGVLIALCISMIILASLYITGTQSRYLNSNPNAQNTDRIFQSQSEDSSPLNSLLISPLFIGIKEGGRQCGVVCASDYSQILYENLSEYISVLFSSQSRCESLPSDLGELLWNTALEGSSYIYIQYRGDIGAGVVRAFTGITASEYTHTATGDALSLSELIIPLNESGNDAYELSAITRNSYGNVARYTPQNGGYLRGDKAPLLLNGYSLDAFFGNEAMVEFSFISETDFYDGVMSATTPVFEVSPRVRKISAAANLLSDIGGAESDAQKSVMRIFGYNPDKQNVKSENEILRTYVEPHGTLQITPSRLVFDGAVNLGADISAYLNHDKNAEQYSVYDYLEVSSDILIELRAINKKAFGGEGEFTLKSVYSESGKCHIIYSYVFDRIEIYGSQSALTAEFVLSGKYLERADICSLEIENEISRTKLLPENFTLEYLMNTRENSARHIKLVYSIQSLPSDYTLPAFALTK